MRIVFLFVGIVLAGALAADESGSKLKLVPSEPLREPEIPKKAVRPDEAPERPSVLKLRPPGDPIYLVAESEEIGGEMRTYRRPKVDAFSRDSEGVALQGYDVISYRERGPEKGQRSFSLQSGGVTWWFASAEHRDLFASDPKRFFPEYGGFCAYSISKGYPATADPRAYIVEGDRLYLFFDRVVLRVWDENKRESLWKADRNWPKVHR